MGGAFLIRIDRIQPDPDQPRKDVDPTKLAELTASVKKHGILQAITVRYLETENVYRIIAGECRYRASIAAGVAEVPCWIRTPKDQEILVHQIVENWHRSQLHPFEIADALAQLRDANHYSQKQLAEETGKPEGEISKFLKLLELSPAAQQEAREDASGVLSFRHLYNIARLEPAQQQAMIEAVREQRLSAVETERRVKEEIEQTATPVRWGAPMTKIEYHTSKAKVTLLFRKQAPDKSDILAALDEAREKAMLIGKQQTLQIHRPK